ncbi:hypothetical protein [Cellulophaga baltica]|uniref:hypothetical protein n=1 Tax=Cellulophaga baltica TaxID=76594 RepID=UPI0003FC8891|nr:hypothetical protein [Cellulophaga baltica]
MKEKPLFHEEQKFTQWWLWLLLLAPIVILFYTLVKPILEDPNQANGNFSFSLIPSNDFWISLGLMLVVLILFMLLKLKTTLSQDYIQVSFFPFFTKKWNWSEINTAEIVTYGFVGYGIRLSLKYGTVYNIKGNQGLAIHLKNGKKLMVGTQKPEELANVIKNK